LGKAKIIVSPKKGIYEKANVLVQFGDVVVAGCHE
jgi:hypothetical protein